MDDDSVEKQKSNLQNLPSHNALMKIVQINHKRMESKHTKVMLTGNNSRVLQFHSFLRLPITSKVIWSLTMHVSHLSQPLSVEGTLISSRKVDDGFEYKIALIGEHKVGSHILTYSTPHHPFSQALQSYTYFYTNYSTKQQIDLLG